MEHIKIRGAQTHNLKNINLDLPRNRLTVITGLSGLPIPSPGWNSIVP